MKKNLFKTLLALITVFSVIFVGCAGDAGGSGESAECEAGKIYAEIPTDPIYKATAELAKKLDPESKKYILFFYDGRSNDYSNRTAYLWVDNGTTCSEAMKTDTSNEYKIGYLEFYDGTTSLGGIPANVITTLDAGGSIKAIVKNTGDEWEWQTNDCSLTTATGDRHFLITSGTGTKSENKTYAVSDDVKPMILGADSQTKNLIKVSLNVAYGLDTGMGTSGFVMKDSEGNEVSIVDSINFDNQSKLKNKAKNVLLTLSNELDLSNTYYISHSLFTPKEGVIVSIQNIVKDSATYNGDDLGLTLNGNKATFKVWAPVASDVTILLYDDVSKVGNYKAETLAYKVAGSTTEVELKGTPSKEAKMTLDTSTGVWSYVIEDVSAYKYYKYQITNNGTTTYVCDIYAKAASPDSIAAQIIDINEGTNYGSKDNYVNPFGNNGTDSKLYSDAIIYEMHIRDWSRAAVADSTGKFLDIANSDEIINHLKDIGITHVQILPMFDYAQVNSDLNYNWGYNPYHYNVPEGRYVEYSTGDGIDAVNQMRSMIEKLHEAGIAVIMDVVYNHTSGTQGGSLYDSTVPYYYYRLNADGSYSNGSGCGNETDSEAPMFKKYMIETLKHWMLDYHINGFRFDLMGLHSKETMAEIYKELSAIDSNVLVYGEPWTGGDARVKNGCTGSVPSEAYGVGAFDDDFRDAIKGAEFGGFNAGEVQGVYNSEGISAGLIGESGKNSRNPTDFIGLGLHYVECHDNFTLFDKLVYSLAENIDAVKEADSKGNIATKWPTTITPEQVELIKKEQTLAGAYVMLSQGTAFMNGGQEFLRTKKGNPDSYSADTKGGVKWTNDAGDKNIDDVNTIDLTFKETYSDVYKTYKGLIAFRKQYSSLFGSFTETNVQKAKDLNKDRVDGVTKYRVDGTTDKFLIYFNATEKDFVPLADDINDYTKVIDVTSGTPTESTTLPESVPAKSFVILKK